MRIVEIILWAIMANIAALFIISVVIMTVSYITLYRKYYKKENGRRKANDNGREID